MENPIVDMMTTTLQKIREMVDANTIVGESILTPDGVTIIPISKISFGFASGGTEYAGKNHPANLKQNFGGGGGAGVNITPIAFLISSKGNVRLLNIAPPAASTSDRLVEMIPDVVDKISDMIDKYKEEKQEKDKDKPFTVDNA